MLTEISWIKKAKKSASLLLKTIRMHCQFLSREKSSMLKIMFKDSLVADYNKEEKESKETLS